MIMNVFCLSKLVKLVKHVIEVHDWSWLTNFIHVFKEFNYFKLDINNNNTAKKTINSVSRYSENYIFTDTSW